MMKQFTAFKTLKVQTVFLFIFYLVMITLNAFSRRKNFEGISIIFLILTVISGVYLVNTYKITIDKEEMIFHRIFGKTEKIAYKEIEEMSFISPKNKNEKVIVLTVAGNRKLYRVAVFDYDEIYALLRTYSSSCRVVSEIRGAK